LLALRTTWVDSEKLIFQVRDTGIGMPRETVDALFQRFHQADGSISRRFGGSGLGLYISENLAHLMGGVLDASSKEGVGSIFDLNPKPVD
jgi:signal transduction histidine kinase